MKGIIFNVVEEVVTELFDADTWDALLESAALEGSYTALGNYEDHELEGIVAAGCAATGETRDQLLQIVGQRALPKLCARVPAHLTAAADPFSFIERINLIIHPEVLKLYPGSVPPIFDCTRSGDELHITYKSKRDLAPLAQGLLHAVGDRFGVPLTVTPLTVTPLSEAQPSFCVSIDD